MEVKRLIQGLGHVRKNGSAMSSLEGGALLIAYLPGGGFGLIIE